MVLTFKPTGVTDKDGKSTPASLGECGVCHDRTFFVVFIGKQTHPHYQCVTCDTSYCGTFDGSQCTDWEGVN
jgi:hypothetical protein